MAVPAKLVIYAKDSKPLSGPVPVKDIEINDLSGSEIQAFLHCVYTEKVKDRLYAIAYHTDFIRKHDPLIITKPIDKLTMSICSYLKNETFLPKIEIRWYKYNEKSKNLEEYFRTTLENARITSQRITLPDVKDKILEKYDQIEEVTFAYQRITWLYHKGYLLFTDEWNECYDELYLKDFSGKEEDPFDFLESMPELEPLKVKFTKAQLVEPEDGFQIDKKVKAKYDSESSREPTMKESKVFAKLYARYKGQVEDLILIQEGWIRDDGTWSTEFKLRKPLIYEKDKDKKDDAVIEYFTEIENRYAGGNFRSEMISVPVKKLKLEIKDMEGPKELVHNRSGIYKVKFNRKASDNEKGKVSWVVRINGKKTDRFENVGETLEFTPIGKYAGETVTVHPFLRSPSDDLCVETTVGECLVFDGSELIWLDEKHNEKGKWKAVSPKNDNSDPKKENGPIPEGRWVVLQTKREIAEKDNWWENLTNRKNSNDSSNERIGLIPFSTTDTHKRDEEFYVHGSKGADAVPGINLEEGIDDFVDSFVNSGKNLVLVVRFAKIEKVHDGVLLKKGDKGEIVEEINIRLSGFGGGPPSDIFDDLTERKIKNFQRDYMKMEEPTGVLDKATVVAIDEFRKQKIITYEMFERLKCKCGNCSGFGKQRYKNVYNSTEKSEKYNKYEYPGIHRSLLWAVNALIFHLDKNVETGARFFNFSSGYRCHDHYITKKNRTTNHMGKAVDIRFLSYINNSWIRPVDISTRNKTVEAVRKVCTKKNWLNAQYGWESSNKFSMETTKQGAVTWVHIDVREFGSNYLSDRFMCSTYSQYLGEPLEYLLKRKIV